MSSDWPAGAPAGAGAESTRVPGIQSVDRAASILELLGRTGSAGVSEVALELDLEGEKTTSPYPSVTDARLASRSGQP